jgi:hypothetical protein
MFAMEVVDRKELKVREEGGRELNNAMKRCYQVSVKVVWAGRLSNRVNASAAVDPRPGALLRCALQTVQYDVMIQLKEIMNAGACRCE